MRTHASDGTRPKTMEAVIHGPIRKKQLPQEIEVWYVLPALRREYAKVFISEHHLSQRQVAARLKVTEAAISQYINGKRGDVVHFSEKVLVEVRKSAAAIVGGKAELFRELERVSRTISVKRIVCEMCRSSNQGLDDCEICFDGNH